MSSITAILLAAGLSRRFGTENKLLVELNGTPMVRRTASCLCDSKAERVIVVLGHEADQVDAALDGLPLETIRNPSYRDGQVTSVRAGLEAVDDDAVGIMMCLSDQPLLNATDYDVLIDAFLDQPTRVVVPFLSGKRGNPVVLPAALRHDILSGGMNVGCRSFIDRHPDLVLPVEVSNPAYRADFDTPEALAAHGGHPAGGAASAH